MTEAPQSNPSLNPGVSSSAVRTPSFLGPELKIRGQINGDEDLRIDGKVDGPISLGGHRLTVGPNSQMSGDIDSREIVVYGDVRGNLLAQDRIDIRRDGSVVGDLTAARITIEDGAHVKGAIEINWGNPRSSTDPNGDLALAVKNFKMKAIRADSEK
jgi:cytoskeletal protein CcmA (bactofilin family)